VSQVNRQPRGPGAIQRRGRRHAACESITFQQLFVAEQTDGAATVLTGVPAAKR
jgi:hypothetical protein